MTTLRQSHELTEHVPQDAVDDLSRRLDAARWPDQLPGTGWSYGVDARYLTDPAGYWRSGYDWRRHVALLNRLPQFTTVIDGQLIHFVHVRWSRPDAMPLLITHGSPSTPADFLSIVGPLAESAAHTSPDAPPCDVVAPSLPGFGFSGPTTDTGWDVKRVTTAWATVIDRLGYHRYVVQGGDFGGLVSPEVARVAPQNVIGAHVNALITTVDWTRPDPLHGLTDSRTHGLTDSRTSRRSRRTRRGISVRSDPATRRSRAPGRRRWPTH